MAEKAVITGWIVVLGFMFALVAFSWFSNRKNAEEYSAYPTIEEYLKAHPEAKTKVGPRCHVCLSNHFGSFEMHTGMAFRNTFLGRIHFCKKCRTKLYRTE